MDGTQSLSGATRKPEASASQTGAADIAQDRSRSREWSADHPVNLRLSIPTPFGSFYMTFVAGGERRSPQRLKSERRKHPIGKLGNILALAVAGSIIGLAIFALFQFGAAYLLDQAGHVVTAE